MPDTSIVPTTSTKALARHAYICTDCGRQWERNNVWTRLDWIRDLPRVFRECPWYEIPVLILMTPLMEAIIMFTENERCPCCHGKCVR